MRLMWWLAAARDTRIPTELDMPSAAYAVFRNAILPERQVACLEQTCVADIDLDINVHVRKLR